jgi:hypothetical protein
MNDLALIDNTTDETTLDLDQLLAKMKTKSALIRYLNGCGWSRYRIAQFMGIRYQHVRNVLITPVKNPK